MPTAHYIPRSLLNDNGLSSLSSLPSAAVSSKSEASASTNAVVSDEMSRQPVEGLPTGWTRILVRRKRGKTKQSDPYYFSPIQSYKFNSMVKVERFLVSLEEAGGDEVAAYAKFGGGSGNAGQDEAIEANTVRKKRKSTMDPTPAVEVELCTSGGP